MGDEHADSENFVAPEELLNDANAEFDDGYDADEEMIDDAPAPI